MHQPLRLAGGPRGIEDVERILGVERLGRAHGRGLCHQLVPPMIAPLDHRQRRSRATINDHMLDGGAQSHGLVHRLLQRNFTTAPVAGILREHSHAARIVHAVGNSVGRESAEDHRVDRADPRTGQQRHHQLRRHTHVNSHTVALFDSEPEQSIRKALHLDVQLRIAQTTHLARLALPDQSRLLRPRTQRMAVHAVIAQVGFAAHKPPCPGLLPVEHLRPRLEPMQIAGNLCPEAFGIGNRTAVKSLVLLEAADVRLGAEIVGWRKNTGFPQRRVDIQVRNSNSRHRGHRYPSGKKSQLVGHGIQACKRGSGCPV